MTTCPRCKGPIGREDHTPEHCIFVLSARIDALDEKVTTFGAGAAELSDGTFRRQRELHDRLEALGSAQSGAGRDESGRMECSACGGVVAKRYDHAGSLRGHDVGCVGAFLEYSPSQPGSLWTTPAGARSVSGLKVDPSVTADDIRAAVAKEAPRVAAFSGKTAPPVAAAPSEAAAVDDDKVPREPGCQCHREIGDSPCLTAPTRSGVPHQSLQFGATLGAAATGGLSSSSPWTRDMMVVARDFGAELERRRIRAAQAKALRSLKEKLAGNVIMQAECSDAIKAIESATRAPRRSGKKG